MAPELFCSETQPTKASDIWSFGLTVLEVDLIKNLTSDILPTLSLDLHGIDPFLQNTEQQHCCG
jgi:hypothetical protein